jgi:hypothetical protein
VTKIKIFCDICKKKITTAIDKAIVEMPVFRNIKIYDSIGDFIGNEKIIGIKRLELCNKCITKIAEAIDFILKE